MLIIDRKQDGSVSFRYAAQKKPLLSMNNLQAQELCHALRRVVEGHAALYTTALQCPSEVRQQALQARQQAAQRQALPAPRLRAVRAYLDKRGAHYLRLPADAPRAKRAPWRYLVLRALSGAPWHEVYVAAFDGKTLQSLALAQCDTITTIKKFCIAREAGIQLSLAAQHHLCQLEKSIEEAVQMATKKQSTKKTKSANRAPAAPRANQIFVLKKQPKDETELPPQAIAILKVLKSKGGKATRAALVAGMEGKVESKQDLSTILSFYRTRLETGGYVKVETESAKPAAKARKATGHSKVAQMPAAEEATA